MKSPSLQLRIGHNFPQSPLSAATPLLSCPIMARLVATGLNFLREVAFSLDLSSTDQDKLQEVLEDYFTTTSDHSDSDSESDDSDDSHTENEQLAVDDPGEAYKTYMIIKNYITLRWQEMYYCIQNYNVRMYCVGERQSDNEEEQPVDDVEEQVTGALQHQIRTATPPQYPGFVRSSPSDGESHSIPECGCKLVNGKP